MLTEHGQKIRDRFISLHLSLIRLHLKHASSIVPPSKTPNTDQLKDKWSDFGKCTKTISAGALAFEVRLREMGLFRQERTELQGRPTGKLFGR